MNFFEYLFLDIILILFPLLLYLVCLSTNKNIKDSSKQVLFNFAIISSYYLVYRNIANDKNTFSLLILSIPILIAYLKNKYILSNILALVTLLIFYKEEYSYTIFIIYILILILYILKQKFNIKNYIFIFAFTLTNILLFIIISFVHVENIGIIENLVLCFTYLIINFIINYLYILGENELKKNIEYKKLQEEKQVRLSLFKITHEIKNPIAVIKGYLDMIDYSDKNKLKKYISIIKSEVDRLLNLLQDFLLINKSKMELDIMDVVMLIEDTIYKIHTYSLNSNVNINYNIIEDEIFINGDYNRLQQVLINVIKNSIESIESNENGKIDVKVKFDEENVYIIIVDNGIGMSKQVLDKIKEPFYTTKLRGSGLGVSLSYEIVEAHNGKISYESKEYKGTTVTITLPIFK